MADGIVVNVKNLTANDITLTDLGSQLIPKSGEWVDLRESYLVQELQDSDDLISALTAGDIAIQDGNQGEQIGATGIKILMGLNGKVRSDDGKKQLVEATNLNIGYDYQFRSFGDLYDSGTDTWTVSAGEGLEGKFLLSDPTTVKITRTFWFSEGAYISGGLLFGVNLPHGSLLNAAIIAPAGADLGQGPLPQNTPIFYFALNAYVNGSHAVDFYVDKAKLFPAGFGFEMSVEVPEVTHDSCFSAMILLQVPSVLGS